MQFLIEVKLSADGEEAKVEITREERTNMARLELQHVGFAYEADRPVFEDVSFIVEANETVGIIGANGVGKSTLLKLIVGLEMIGRGEIRIDGEPLTDKTVASLRRKEGYVFQDAESQLFMGTVYEDVAFAPRNYGADRETVEERVANALELTGISHLRDRHIYKLSGGEKKLASIATILSTEPEIILMDEPSVALDPCNRDKLIRVINGLPGMKLLASHDLDFIYDTCQRTLVLANGGIVYDGPTEQVLKDKAFLEQYGLRLPLSFRFGVGRECR